jgi:hypothetical protein
LEPPRLRITPPAGERPQGNKMTALSLRRLWTMYKKLLVEDGMSRRNPWCPAADYPGFFE